MFGKKNKEIARLTKELAAANASLIEMRALYETKLSDAKADINAREATIASRKIEIGNLENSLENNEKERKHLSSARDILASSLQDEGSARTNAESFLQAARRGEDPETDAFYTAKFASAKAEPEIKATAQIASPGKANEAASASTQKKIKSSRNR